MAPVGAVGIVTVLPIKLRMEKLLVWAVRDYLQQAAMVNLEQDNPALFIFSGEVNMWARIENNEVMEITDIDPAGRFHPSLIWVECPADIKQGYSFDGESFMPPVEVAM